MSLITFTGNYYAVVLSTKPDCHCFQRRLSNCSFLTHTQMKAKTA